MSDFSVSTTGTAASGSTTLGVASANGISGGQLVTGPGIAAGTTVAAVSGTTITLSAAVTTTLSSTPVTFATTGVTVSYLTFDGNRYNFGIQGSGISCLTDQLSKIDLDLSSGGNFTAEWLDFVNSPDTAVHLSGLSTLSYSNLGMGTSSGIGPNGLTGPEDGPQTATRFTAVYLSGGSSAAQSPGSAAYYNSVYYAGTAGITLDGYDQIVYGNWLFNNRYEMSDGSGGGQLTLWPGPFGTAALASVAGNVINGNNWDGGQSTETLCPITGPLQSNSGVEANGTGHRFYNNELYENSGGGMVVNLGDPTAQILVSSTNPWYSGDTPRYIEANGYGGITFYGSSRGWSPIQGVSLDDVLIANNAIYGVYFDNVQNYGSYLGFVQNGSCMWGNEVNGSEADVSWPNGPNQGNTQPAPNTPTYLYPSSTSLYQGGPCPSQPAGQATPAPSGLPPSQWKW
jgi:hypothetical protein